MRKIYSFAVLLTMLLAVTTAKAQNFEGEATATYYGSQGYKTTPITFSLSAVSDAFGISSAAELAQMLNAQFPEDQEDAIDRGITVFAIQSDASLFEGIYNEEQNTFTATPAPGFYMNASGDVVNWGDQDNSWFAFITWDADADQIIFNCGRKAADDAFTEGFTGTGTFYIRYNNSVALSFKLHYTVEPKPEALEVVTDWNALTIAEGVTVELSQDPRTNYNSDLVRVEVPTLFTDLGITSSELVMATALYARSYQNDTWQDVIFNTYSATPTPGFWFGSTFNEDTEKDDNVNLAARNTYTDALFYASDFQYVREEGVDYITFIVGQEPSAAKGTGDEEYHATVYVVAGNKAFPINIVLKINFVDHTADPNLTSYAKAGEVSLLIEGEYDPSYVTIHAPIDAAAIAEALGAESPQDVQLWVRTVAEGETLKRYDDGDPSGDISWVDEGVMWINNQGVEVGWNSNAATMISYQMLADGTYTIGAMDMPGGQFADETAYTTSVFLCYPATQKYYEVIFTRRVSGEAPPDKVPMEQWTRTKFFNLTISVIPDTDDHNAGTYQLPWSEILAATGSENTKYVKLYGQRPIEGEEADLAGDGLTFTNSYTCTPYPGFWLMDGKYPCAYAENNSYGMTLSYSTGVMTIWNIPNARTAGETFNSVFYIVDEVTGKYAQLNITLKFVETLNPIEEVGESNIYLIWEDWNKDWSYNYNVVDLSDLYTKLLDGDETLLVSCDWLLYKDGDFVRCDFSPEYNIFDEEGNFLGDASLSDTDPDAYDELYNSGAFSIGYSYEESAFSVMSLANENWVGGVKKVDVAVDYDNKRYILHVFVGTEEQITGISDIKAVIGGKAEVFDLSGRRVVAPVKGLYILNGKKILVK